ncbi:MAG: hypothetical protein ACJ72A_07535 [Nocardioidaceae bacterium]|jgi:hypothetical protein
MPSDDEFPRAVSASRQVAATADVIFELMTIGDGDHARCNAVARAVRDACTTTPPG